MKLTIDDYYYISYNVFICEKENTMRKKEQVF